MVVNSDFSRRVRRINLSAIKEVAAEVKRNSEVISLAQGLPSFSTPKHIRDAVAEALRADEKGIGAYSLYSGTRELKAAIGKKLEGEIRGDHKGRGYGIDVEQEVFVTVGAMEGLAASVMSLVDEGDEVILPSPNYPPHIVEVGLAGGKAVFVPLRKSEIRSRTRTSSAIQNLKELVWTWSLGEIESAITEQTKVIFFTNPGNPTGCLFNEELLQGIVELASKHNLWVLADETYAYLTYDGLPHTSLGRFRSEYEKLIVVRSFSKEYAMTGWRLGYVYAPEELVVQALKVHDALVGCPSSLSQKGGVAALTGSQGIVDEFRGELSERRELICGRLNKLDKYIEYAKPQGAYYVWVKLRNEKGEIKNMKAEEFALRMIKEARVAVVPGEAFGPGGEEYFRVCFAVSREDINEAFDRIEEWIKSF